MKMRVSHRKAFTLVELLVVIGLISIMVSLVVIGSFKESNKISTAGNLTVDLMNHARRIARTHNTLAMLAIQNEGEDAGRALNILSFSVEEGKWTQIDRWRVLPEGVEINMAVSEIFFTNPPVMALPITRGGKNIDCLAAVFLPDGRVQTASSEPLVVQLNRTRGDAHNFYKIIINQGTGTPIVRRP